MDSGRFSKSITMYRLLLCVLLFVACEFPVSPSPVTVNNLNVIKTDTLSLIDTVTIIDTVTRVDTLKDTVPIIFTDTLRIPVLKRDTIHDTIRSQCVVPLSVAPVSPTPPLLPVSPTPPLLPVSPTPPVITDTVIAAPIGFRYYKFVVDSAELAGTAEEQCAILTETAFKKDNRSYPEAGTYDVVSYSQIDAGDIGSLFDGDATTGASTGHYAKFVNRPWEWIINVRQAVVYDSLYLSSWETFYYREPSKISVYGSNSLCCWTLIGQKSFSRIYQRAAMALRY